MRIVIIENEVYWLKRCERVIQSLLIKWNLEIAVVAFDHLCLDLRNIIYDGKENIYIIDMKLGNGLTGYDVIAEIRDVAFDWKSLILISSAVNEMENVISSRLAIYTYILKDAMFDFKLRDSIFEAIHILTNHRLVKIKEHGQEYTLAIQDIEVVEKEKNSKYCIVKTFYQEFRVRTSLCEINKDLNFKRINGYTLVNPIYEKRLKSSLGNE